MKVPSLVKNIIAISLLAVFGLVATGCGKKQNNTATAQPAKVRVWRVGQSVDALRGAFTSYKETFPNTKLTYKKNDLVGYEVAALTSSAGRQGPDIWSIPNDWLGDYVNQTVPLPENYFVQQGVKNTPKPQDEIKARFPEGIAKALIRPDGKVYGMPTNVDTLRLYYNPKLFDIALEDFRKSQGSSLTDQAFQPVRLLLSKPPATWSDLVAQTRYITQRNGTAVTRSTIALGSADNIPDSQEILQLLIMQNGSDIINSDRTRALFHNTITTPSGSVTRPGEQALDFFTSFSKPEKQTYSWNPSMPQALDAFAQGKVAMVIAFSDFGKDLRVKYPNFSFLQAAVPQVSVASSQSPVNIIKFYTEAVTSTADNQNAAFTFLKYYTNRDAAKGVADEARLISPYLTHLNATTDPVFRQVLTGRSIYKVHHNTFDAIWYQMIRDVSQNGIAPAQALDTAAQKINDLLVPKKDANETTF